MMDSFDHAFLILVAQERVTKGGLGSGNFGHAGRPGEVGGSTSSGEENSSTKGSAPVSSSDFVKMFGEEGHDIQSAMYDYQHEDLPGQVEEIQRSAASDNKDPRIRLIDRYIREAPKISQDVLYHGERKGTKTMLSMEVGKSFVHKTYLSGSVSKGMAENFKGRNGGMVIIRGSRGVAAKTPSGYDAATREKEGLFPRNTKFEIISKKEDEIVIKVVD